MYFRVIKNGAGALSVMNLFTEKTLKGGLSCYACHELIILCFSVAALSTSKYEIGDTISMKSMVREKASFDN